MLHTDELTMGCSSSSEKPSSDSKAGETKKNSRDQELKRRSKNSKPRTFDDWDSTTDSHFQTASTYVESSLVVPTSGAQE